MQDILLRKDIFKNLCVFKSDDESFFLCTHCDV